MKSDVTVTVDINENQLMSFTLFQQTNFHSLNEEGHKKLFESYKFVLYRKRMMGDYMITIQIPLVDYCLYLSNNIVI